MRKKGLPMSDATYIDQAAAWSKAMTRMKSRGPGDTENAMRAVGREYGLDYWVLWRLRYRRQGLQDIGVSIYMALKAAYQAECERQIKKLEHDIAITEKITGPDSAAVRASRALVGKIHTGE